MLIRLNNGRWVDPNEITGIHVSPNRNENELDTPWVAIFTIQKRFTSYTRHLTEKEAQKYADHVGCLCVEHKLRIEREAEGIL